MFTINGLKAGSSAHFRRSLIILAGSITALAAGVAIAASSFRDDDAEADVRILGFLMAPGLVALFGGLLVAHRLARRDERVRCPGCGAILLGGSSLVFATG